MIVCCICTMSAPAVNFSTSGYGIPFSVSFVSALVFSWGVYLNDYVGKLK